MLGFFKLIIVGLLVTQSSLVHHDDALKPGTRIFNFHIRGSVSFKKLCKTVAESL